jgi:hypothetical protein
MGSVDWGTSSGFAMLGDVPMLDELEVLGVLTDGALVIGVLVLGVLTLGLLVGGVVVLGVLSDGELVDMPLDIPPDDIPLDGVGVERPWYSLGDCQLDVNLGVESWSDTVILVFCSGVLFRKRAASMPSPRAPAMNICGWRRAKRSTSAMTRSRSLPRR